MKNSYQDHFKKVKSRKNPPRFNLKNSEEGNSKRDIDKVKDAIKNVKLKKERRRKSFFSYVPLKTSLLVVIFMLVAVWGLFRPADFESILSGVDISMFAEGLAESKGKDKKDAGKTEKTSDKDKAEKTDDSNSKTALKGKKNYTDEDINYFKQLNSRKLELDQREVELEKLEEELQKQKIEIHARIQKLKLLRTNISKILKDRVDVDKKKVKKLVEFYSNMKPQQASVLLSKLDEDLAVEILGQMKKKNAADILNLIEPDKAQNLSEKFAGYRFK